jgi:hypothetical protein
VCPASDLSDSAAMMLKDFSVKTVSVLARVLACGVAPRFY